MFFNEKSAEFIVKHSDFEKSEEFIVKQIVFEMLKNCVYQNTTKVVFCGDGSVVFIAK